MGGFLSQPADKYTVFQVEFFCQFPYLMPCLVGAFICVVGLISECFVSFLYLTSSQSLQLPAL